MPQEITVFYSPICRACENDRYYRYAQELGYTVKEVSILELTTHPEKFDAAVHQRLNEFKRQGGFLAAPVAIVNGKLVPAWEIESELKLL